MKKETAAVFGLGQNYIKNKEKIHREFDVVALVDNNPKACIAHGGGKIGRISSRNRHIQYR